MMRRVGWWLIHHFYYPGNDGTLRRRDPSHGRIDRDIQWWVNDRLNPSTLGSRVASEDTLQSRRNLGRLP